MYPIGELKALEERKLTLRARIDVSRWTSAESFERVSRPLAIVDGLLAKWRSISPFVKFGALPLGFILKRTVAPRLGLFTMLVKWAPTLFRAARMGYARFR